MSFGFPLSSAAHTDVGRVRTNNEDSYGHRWLDDGSLFVIVADGMGGHEAGEVASGLAVQVVEEVVERDPEGDPRERMYNALLEANAAILDEGDRGGTRGMGTTAICSLIRGNEAYVALVGDSRCYHIRRGQLLWRTLDHTRIQMLLDTGEIDEEQARNHPEAGMLTRALGHERMADGRALEPDVLAEPLLLGDDDSLILCSDGLHDLVEDWEIGRIVAGKSPDVAAQALVDAACERGGHDNITVAVITAGEVVADFDPNYVPEYYGGRDPNDTLGEPEPTFDELGPQSAEPTPMPLAAAPKRNTGLIMVGVLIVFVLLMMLAMALLLGVYFFL